MAELSTSETSSMDSVCILSVDNISHVSIGLMHVEVCSCCKVHAKSPAIPLCLQISFAWGESWQIKGWERLLPCLLCQLPVLPCKSSARMQRNSQETGNGKVEGQRQTKAAIYLTPTSVKFLYAAGKGLLHIRFNFAVRNCNHLLKTFCWPQAGQIMWRLILPVSRSCRSNISNLSGRQDSVPVTKCSLINCLSNWGQKPFGLPAPFWDVQARPNHALVS